MARKLDITIIGPGVVGRALGQVAHRAGYRIAAVAGGAHPARTASFAATVDEAAVLPLAKAAAEGQLVLLTVNDTAIASVCDQLAAAGGLARRPIVAHCSGALGSDVLASARAQGCAVGSMHPLQTFPNVAAAVAHLPGTRFFIEGDASAVETLEALASAMGGHPFRIASEAKCLYHAAAVLSANGLTTLLDAALALYEAVGLERDEARAAMGPLVRATVENVLDKGPIEALTGPIARGDAQVVVRHVEALKKEHPDIAVLYQTLGRRTVELARKKGKIDEVTIQILRDILGQEPV